MSFGIYLISFSHQLCIARSLLSEKLVERCEAKFIIQRKIAQWNERLYYFYFEYVIYLFFFLFLVNYIQQSSRWWWWWRSTDDSKLHFSFSLFSCEYNLSFASDQQTMTTTMTPLRLDLSRKFHFYDCVFIFNLISFVFTGVKFKFISEKYTFISY